MQKKFKVLGVVKKLALAKKGIYDGLSVTEQNPLSEIAVEYMKIADLIIRESESVNNGIS